jgi:perosamine synthetase
VFIYVSIYQNRMARSIKPVIGKDEINAVLDVLNSGIISEFSGANKVDTFEEEFATYIGTNYAVAVNSGTAALHVAYRSAGIGPGDKVIVPPFTFVSSVSPLIQLGAIPIFSDISEDDYCLDPDALHQTDIEEAKAILPVHLYGNTPEIRDVLKISNENNLIIIEDCCQAHGTTYNGRKVGTFGTSGCFSFALMKNMTTGEGGMLVTDDEKIATDSKLMRQNGKSSWKDHAFLGYNYRLTELQAAIGLVQLKKLDEMNKRRQEISRIYRDELENTDLTLPTTKDHINNVFFKFPVLLPKHESNKKDTLIKRVNHDGKIIESGYSVPLYEIPFLTKYKRPCPVADNVMSRTLNLYTTPGMDDDFILDICGIVKTQYKKL